MKLLTVFCLLSSVAVARVLEDFLPDCAKWAEQKKCGQEFVAQYCEKSCAQGEVTVQTIFVNTTNVNGTCFNKTDTNNQCSEWAKTDHCTSMKWGNYMQSNCALSCCQAAQVVGPKDTDHRCDHWANASPSWCGNNEYVDTHCKQACYRHQCRGWVGSNDPFRYCITSTYVRENCQAECRNQDKDERCSRWTQGAQAQEWCTSNDYVKSHCPVSCSKVLVAK